MKREYQRPGRETTMSKWTGMTIAPAGAGRFRSLEGRPLGMSSSVMLPESARLKAVGTGGQVSSPHWRNSGNR